MKYINVKQLINITYAIYFAQSLNTSELVIKHKFFKNKMDSIFHNII